MARRPQSRADAIEQMIAKYAFSEKLDVQVPSAFKTTGLVVLLTGSTGNLGSQVLDQLLRHPDISKVYALNRPSSASISDRHLDRFRDKGLDTSVLSSNKLVYLESDISQDRLGLSESAYNEVTVRNYCLV